MKCPACGSEMRHRVIGDIEIDVCGRCNGVWLDATELDGVLGVDEERSVEAMLDESARRPECCRYCGKGCGDSSVCSDCDQPIELKCPRGGEAMYIVEAVGIELDRCPDCRGLWVDGFERSKLSQMRDDLRQQAVRIQAASEASATGDQTVAALIGMGVAGGEGLSDGLGWGGAQKSPQDQDDTNVIEAQDSGERSGFDEADGSSETGGEPCSMREYIKKHGNFEIMCSECSEVLSRYTAWEKEGVFFCIPCAEEAGHDGMSDVTRGKLAAAASQRTDYWHDEGHLVEALQWLVGGIFRWKGKD